MLVSFERFFVSTSLIDKVWGLFITGLADVCRFKCYILQCIKPCIIPWYLYANVRYACGQLAVH